MVAFPATLDGYLSHGHEAGKMEPTMNYNRYDYLAIFAVVALLWLAIGGVP
jgi:hypothetical protein